MVSETWSSTIVLGPREAVAHLEEVAQGDAPARIARGGPLGDGGRLVEGKPPLVDEEPDRAVEDGLGHRPAEERRVDGDGPRRLGERRQRAPVALRDESTPLHDDDGVGRLEGGVLEGGVDERADAVGRLARRPRRRRPGDAVGLGCDGGLDVGKRRRHARVSHAVARRDPGTLVRMPTRDDAAGAP